MRTKLIVSFVVSLLAVNGVASAKSWRVAGAIVHMRQDEYEAAIKLLEEDVAESPSSAEAWAYLGDAYAHEGEYMEAAGAWSRAEEIYTEKKKKKKIDKILRSREYFWSQAFNAAHKCLARALSFDNPDFVPLEGETVGGNLEKAEEGFIATYHVFSSHPKTLFLLGLVYEDKAAYYAELDEEDDVAVTDYDLDTGAAAQREVKAGDYVEEMWSKALDTYEAAAEAKQADMAGENWDEKTPLSDYLVKVVNACLRLEKYERALAIIEPLLAETPDDMMLLNAKAAVLDKLGRVGEAIEAYEKVAASVTDVKIKAEVLGEIASYYLRKEYEGRDPKKAIEVLEEAMVLAPEDYRIFINLGKAYGEVGEYEKGKEFLRKGQELYEKQRPPGGG
ncbi:MAG: tetratricopeptide repeat protein [candidate division Zixibacteria bacterium]|nr:tetratricopeptide repeat protein [candidate division Zixibacteria bacterium]